eukprot:gene2052-2530_t
MKRKSNNNNNTPLNLNKTFPSFQGKQSSLLDFQFVTKIKSTEDDVFDEKENINSQHTPSVNHKVDSASPPIQETTKTTTTVTTIEEEIEEPISVPLLPPPASTPVPNSKLEPIDIDDCQTNDVVLPTPSFSPLPSSKKKKTKTTTTKTEVVVTKTILTPTSSSNNCTPSNSGSSNKSSSSPHYSSSPPIKFDITGALSTHNNLQLPSPLSTQTPSSQPPSQYSSPQNYNNKSSPSPSQQQQNQTSPTPSPYSSQKHIVVIDEETDPDITITGISNSQPVFKSPSSTPQTQKQQQQIQTIIEDKQLEIINVDESRYYLKDFQTVTETVYNRDSHLFIEQEKEFIHNFLQNLTRNAKYLFVRLYNRKGPWFQSSTLKYEEIVNIPEAIKELVRFNFLIEYQSSEHDYNEIAQLLRTDQLRSIVGNHIPSSTSKPILLEIINGKPYKGQLTLGNSSARYKNHNSSQIIVNNILGIKYPEYKVWTNNTEWKIFPTRQHLLEYEQIKELEHSIQYIYESSENNNILQIMEQCAGKLNPYFNQEVDYGFASKFSPGWVYTRVISTGTTFLEKMKKYEESINYLMMLLESPFCRGKRGYWYLRMVVNFKHLNRLEDALVICERSLKDPMVKSGDRLALEKHINHLSVPPRRWKVNSDLKILPNIKPPKIVTINAKKVRPNGSGRKSKYLMDDGTETSVEGITLEHFKNSDQWNGKFCETSLFIAIFVLFFWDIIFDDSIPLVFQSPFQDAPLDFGSNEFYYQRKSNCDKRLQEIENADGTYIQNILEQSWENNGYVVRGINWSKYDLEELLNISKCLGGGLISFISKLLLEDFKYFSKGMPDLFLWKMEETKQYIKFVEVKGEGDSLRDQQQIWIDMLISFGVDVEVCHVKSQFV